MKKLPIQMLLVLLLSCLAGCGAAPGEPAAAAPTADGISYADAQVIRLDGDSASLDGTALEEFDYTWHCDPSQAHDEVKNAPAEYYTGTEPQTQAPAYIDQELYYFPTLEESGFSLENYDGEREWLYRYTDGVNEDYIFATLPALGQSLPTQMMHSPEEAAANKVLHITQPGTYVLEGSWDGQIWVELGDEEECFSDPEAKICLVLNGVEIDCSVAPGIVFRSAYECDNAWEEQESWSIDVDTSQAGVQVVLADGTENSVSGCNIFRMLKTSYKDEDATDPVKVQKKLRKIDGAFYSYVSMNISGGGALTVNSNFEGMDSELHLSVNGGQITINSQDDGINVNEDHVSVVSFNGGDVTLNAAQGDEGDGVDSNGYILLNGGTLRVNGVRPPDSALDSEDGVLCESGTLFMDGEEQSYTPGELVRELGGGMGGFPGGEDFDLASFKEEVAALGGEATLQDVMGLLNFGRQQGERPEGGLPEAPEGKEPPAELPQGMQPPEGEDPDGMETPPELLQDMNSFPGEENFDLASFKEEVAALGEDATLQDVLNLLGFSEMRGGRPEGERPDSMEQPREMTQQAGQEQQAR